MVELPQKVLGWLHSVLLSQEYHDVNRTFSDVAQTLSQNSTIRPQTDVYTFENGGSSLLLHLAGTIPVSFRGTIYSFPISIWVTHGYPQEGPIIFVTPTRDMAIRPGQHVSGEGRVYHPYLANWRPDRSNIDECLQILRDVFSREPPVVSKQDIIAGMSLPSMNSEPPPLPPLPPELGGSTPRDDHTRLQRLLTGQPPPPPPKPFQSNDGQRNSQYSGGPPAPPLLGRTQSRNVQVSHPPPSTSRYLPQRHGSLQSEHFNSALPMQAGKQSIVYGQQHGFPGQSQISVNASSYTGAENSAAQERYQRATPRLPGAIQPPNAAYNWQNQPQQAPYSDQNPNKHELYPNHNHRPPAPKPPEDLLTSPFDMPLPSQISNNTNIPAPPIPPNPEKDALLSVLSRTLTEHLHSAIASNANMLPPLHAQHAAMQVSLQKMQQEHRSLTTLSDLLASDEAILHKAMRDADKCIADTKHRTVPGVDEVLVAPTVVGEQLYKLVAEERACMEARAVLGKALDKGRVGCEGWVKGVRGLAREEFLKKVLVKKCAKGMALRDREEWI